MSNSFAHKTSMKRLYEFEMLDDVLDRVKEITFIREKKYKI